MGISAASPAAVRVRRAFAPEHRAFWLIVLNGVLWRLSAEMFDGRRVVAAFLTELSGWEWLVGVAIAIQPTVMSFPQLYESYLVSDGRSRMPYYRKGAWIRRAALVLMVLVVVALAHHPLLVAALFIPLLGLLGLGEGVGSVAFGDIVTRTVKPHRRGRMFGLRMAFGGLGAFWLGLVVRQVLRRDFTIGFPYNYSLLFAASLVFLVWAQEAFMRVDEPAMPRRERPAASFREYVQRAVAMVRREKHVRRYLLFRCFTPGLTMPQAFLVPFVLKKLHFEPSVVGLFLSTSVIASVVSNIWWAWISDRLGNRLLLRLSIGVIVACAAMLAATPSLQAGGASQDMLLAWVLVVNAVTEIGLVGMIIGQINYLYELAPPGEVPLYTGLISTTTAPLLATMPILFGFAAGHWGYAYTFAGGLAFGLAALGLSLVLAEPRHRRAG